MIIKQPLKMISKAVQNYNMSEFELLNVKNDQEKNERKQKKNTDKCLKYDR